VSNMAVIARARSSSTRVKPVLCPIHRISHIVYRVFCVVCRMLYSVIGGLDSVTACFIFEPLLRIQPSSFGTSLLLDSRSFDFAQDKLRGNDNRKQVQGYPYEATRYPLSQAQASRADGELIFCLSDAVPISSGRESSLLS
jgi:hypothetical protein